MHLNPRTGRRLLISLTPMIDVVFIMLIFFMVTGRPTVPDPFQIEPPASASEGPMNAQELLVLIGADGRLALDGIVMSEQVLKSNVSNLLTDNQSMKVRLKADAQVQATRVIGVMEVLQQAGVDQFKLLTVQTGD